MHLQASYILKLLNYLNWIFFQCFHCLSEVLRIQVFSQSYLNQNCSIGNLCRYWNTSFRGICQWKCLKGWLVKAGLFCDYKLTVQTAGSGKREGNEIVDCDILWCHACRNVKYEQFDCLPLLCSGFKGKCSFCGKNWSIAGKWDFSYFSWCLRFYL